MPCSRSCRTTRETKHAPVIVVSAFLAQLRVTPQVRRVLAKPFDVTDLLDAVAREIDRGAPEASR